MLTSYINAFQKHYPSKKVEIKPTKPKKGTGEAQWHVYIDGDHGNRAMTASEIHQATLDFNK